jgi:hypothetical protein
MMRDPDKTPIIGMQPTPAAPQCLTSNVLKPLICGRFAPAREGGP